MLDIPFHLETVPADNADKALELLIRNRTDAAPVLLGDADIFSAEWAEFVDEFESPEEVLDAARAVDTEAWFASQPQYTPPAAKHPSMLYNGFYRAVAFPFDMALLPVRLASWPLTRKKPSFFTRPRIAEDHQDNPVDAGVAMLKAQLEVLEAAGEGTREELDEIREIIDEIEADGACFFPDPVAYVTPRHGGEVAAGMVKVTEPWEAAAWLQHGTYALCAPKPVFVAHCKWMWDVFGSRIITASTDHLGFQMERPIDSSKAAKEVLHRFQSLGATEINAEHRGGGGNSLLNAERLWVWWD